MDPLDVDSGDEFEKGFPEAPSNIGSHEDEKDFSGSVLGQMIASDFLNSSETLIMQENEAARPPLVLAMSPELVAARKRSASYCSDSGKGCVSQVELVNVNVGPQHFELLKLIGEGGFGKVVLVKSCLDDKLYAMKVISKKLLKKKNHVSYMKSERDILTKISCPFVVSLHFAFHTETKLFLVMDYLSGGELFFHLRRRGLILEREAEFYFGEMILAIEFLHSVNIIHRDLKPENILLTADGHVCITDFGLAKEIGDTASGADTRTLCGTSEYMAPEMISRTGYGRAADWWSLGAIFFEMLSGNPPFRAKTQKELDKKILTEKFVAPTFLTGHAVSLLKGMLDKDAAKRLGDSKATRFQLGGVTLLKRHQFFESTEWESLARRLVPPPIIVNMDANSVLEASNFHEGFTTQTLSPSLVIDAMSNDGASVRSLSPQEEADPFSDFGYTVPNFQVPKEKVIEFENNLAAKMAKNAKKKQHLLKLEAQRAAKQAELEAQRQQQAQLRRMEAERARAARQQQEQDRAKMEEHIKASNLYTAQMALYRSQQTLLSSHADTITTISKKIKSLRKKLRDIEELESKIKEQGISLKKLTPEQREKLGRRQALEDEVAEQEDRDCSAEEAFSLSMGALLADPAAAATIKTMATVPPTDASLLEHIGSMSVSSTPCVHAGVLEVVARLGFPLFAEPVRPPPLVLGALNSASDPVDCIAEGPASTSEVADSNSPSKSPLVCWGAGAKSALSPTPATEGSQTSVSNSTHLAPVTTKGGASGDQGEDEWNKVSPGRRAAKPSPLGGAGSSTQGSQIKQSQSQRKNGVKKR